MTLSWKSVATKVAASAAAAATMLGFGVATANAAVTDKPLFDPGNIMIQKAIADMDQAGVPEGDMPSLAGVKFRIEYFKNLYNSEAELNGKTPNASAVWATDEDGVLDYVATNPVEGSWPYQYTDNHGVQHNVFPLGTVRITEVEASNWSVLSPQPRVFKVIDSGDHENAIIEQISPWKDSTSATAPEGSLVVAFPNEAAKGSVEVVKTDDQTTHTPQGDGELAGVEYTIYNQSTGKNPTVRVNGKDYAKGAAITTITTSGKDGKFVAATAEQYLPFGTYQIKETRVPAGYHNTNFNKTFSITENGQKVSFSAATGDATTGTESWNANDVQRGGFQLLKLDRETGTQSSLGEAHLDGAKFDVINSSKHPVVYPKNNGKTYQPGDKIDTLAISYQEIVDKNGKGTGKKGYALKTDKDALPFGTYTVRESGAGTGYLQDSTSRGWSKTITIGKSSGHIATDDYQPGAESPNQFATVTISDGDLAKVVSNQVQRTDLHFIKKDADSMERMGGIAWMIRSKTTGETHFVVSDDNGELHTKSCDAAFNDNGTGTTGCRPHTANTNVNDPDSPISNGAIKDDGDGNYTVADTSKLNNTAGVWFTGIGPKSKAKDGSTVKWKDANTYTVTDAAGVSRDVKVKNNLRALPYDTYELTELKTPGKNDGKKMVSVTFKAHEFTKNPDGTINNDGNGIDFDYGTIDNKSVGMGTRLAYMGEGADAIGVDGESGDKVAPATNKVVLTDVVDYWGVDPGKYSIDAQLYVVENGKTVGEPVTTGHKGITVKNPITGRAAVTFEAFDASKYQGKTLVAFETMVDAKGDVVTEHRDPADEDQWIKIPSIGTSAIGDIDDEALADRDTPLTVTDTVKYTNLEVGKTYTINGELHKREADENGKMVDKGVVKDVEGNEVKASRTFTPETENGTVDMTFTFMPGKDFAGTSVVAFESVAKKDVAYAAHADITDKGQDIHFPELETQAMDAADSDKQLGAYENKSIKDTVKYKNLTAGRQYTMTATIHVKSVDGDGKVVDAGELKDKDGNTITKSVTFTPSAPNGTIDVVFDGLDLRDYVGKSVVAFEKLHRGDVILGTHMDIEDEGQSVHIPQIGTNMVDGNNTGEANEDGSTNGAKEIQVTNPTSQKTIKELIEAATKADDEADDTDDKSDADNTTTAIDWASLLDSIKSETCGVGASNVLCVMQLDENTPINGVNWGAIKDGMQTLEFGDISVPMPIDKNITDKSMPFSVSKNIDLNGKFDERMMAMVKQVLSNAKLPTVAVPAAEPSTDGEGNTSGDKSDADADDSDADADGDTAGDTVGDTEGERGESVDGDNESSATVNPDDKSMIDLKLVDTVRYKNLIKGEKYRVQGGIHVAGHDDIKTIDEGVLKDKDGKEVNATAEFTAEAPDGYVELTFEATVPASALVGKKLVAFEQLFKGNELVADHEDITDEGQTVGIVDLGTKAIDVTTNGNVGSLSNPVTIKDTVGYTGLTPGKNYTVNGALHIKGKDGKDMGVAKDKDGKEVTATASFTPAQSDGTVELTFTFTPDKGTAAALAGSTLVAFEDLVRDGFVIATHADINDKDQSVNWIKIGTTLTGKNGVKTVDASDGKAVDLIDSVAYENVVPGLEYTMCGQLMKDGKKFGDVSCVTFTPKETSGTVDVPFVVDATDFGVDTTLVAFETMTVKNGENEIVVAEHKDLNDKNQTILIAKPATPVEKAWIGLKTGLTFHGTQIALIVMGVTLALAGYAVYRRRQQMV